MRNKIYIFIAVISIHFISFQYKESYCAEQTPEQLVSEFYSWYIEESRDIHKIPVKDDTIYKYVYACTINKLRIDYKKGVVFSDYFLDSNDFDYEYFKTLFNVHNTVKITDSVSIVTVGAEKPDLLVYVQKTKDGWRIIKVERAVQDYSY